VVVQPRPVRRTGLYFVRLAFPRSRCPAEAVPSNAALHSKLVKSETPKAQSLGKVLSVAWLSNDRIKCWLLRRQESGVIQAHKMDGLSAHSAVRSVRLRALEQRATNP